MRSNWLINLQFILRFISDAFKMPKIPTRENLFSQYSESLNSYDENGVYTYVHKTSFGSYGFVGIDLTPNPGPGRPFNFFSIPRKVGSQVTIVDVC